MAISRFRAALEDTGKTQTALLREIQKRGYPRMNAQRLSSIGTGMAQGPQADNVCKLAEQIIDEWRTADRIAREHRKDESA